MAALEHLTQAEYHVLLLDDVTPGWRASRLAAAGTLGVHLLVVLALFLTPRSPNRDDREVPMKHRVTHLIDPPTRLTQRAPNKAPVSPQISVAPSAPVPATARTRKFQPPPPARTASRVNPTPAAPQEPPKINAPQPRQTVQLTPPAALPTPPPASEQPKLVLENPPAPPQPGMGTGRLKVPGGGIDEAVRELSHSGTSSSRLIGDNTDDLVFPGPANGKAAATRPKSSLELVSDPNGVDMRPYLLQVLQSVRRNWATIYPESARLGLRGRVVMEFAILPSGSIARTVFTAESGKEALDRAAVAALSMSNPLPQLPPEYKGSRLVLRFTFLYNAPR